MLLADTGLLDGESATVHWAYEDGLRRHYPTVALEAKKVMVEAGSDGRLITTGGHAAWYDAVLHLIGRTCGPEAAARTARFFLIDWHAGEQTAYAAFRERTDHGDAVVRECQAWLARNLSDPTPVESVEGHSGLAPRTFKRRFKNATGLTVIDYVQRLRVERAKSLLEGGDAAVDDVSWRVGYEDVAFFRRLFKRTTGMAPGAYRKRFRIPDFARP
jgi:transcriptional regulator GlxA family with amidase domain